MSAPPFFYGTEQWRKLTPDQQNEIGAMACELSVAGYVGAVANKQGTEHITRACDAVVDRLVQDIAVLVLKSIPQGALSDLPLPSVVGNFCTLCGCTHLSPCSDSCWTHNNGQASCVCQDYAKPRTTP